EYQPGMDRRSIDWKGSARHSKLLAKEYDTERNNQIVFALDCGSTMCEPIEGLPRIDRAVSAALLTAYITLKSGDQTSLFSFAAKPEVSTPFLSGSRNFYRLQQDAATINYRHQESNYTLALSALSSRLKRRSLIIIFTDFTDPTAADLMLEAAARLIDKHLVLFVVLEDKELSDIIDRQPETAEDVARSVTAQSLLDQKKLVVTRLQHIGIDVIEGAHENIGTRLINSYLKIKRRGQL
ncbi:putative membrane protein, partial [hydrothermal vent metagenome]